MFSMSIKTVCGADPKTASQKFITNNFREQCEHMFDNFHDAASGEPCLWHPDGTNCTLEETIDCLATGMPCQAWCRLRFASKSSTPPSSHPG
jgi:hypothetical protein